jgi:hypothetical protein
LLLLRIFGLGQDPGEYGVHWNFFLTLSGLSVLTNLLCNHIPSKLILFVGFAMGITGTQVAKDAADIILLDDNFSSIVNACKWGRNVYESIAKFLQFQLTVNIVAVTLAVLGSITGSVSPLKAVQLLWVNLIMDSLGSLALATEPPNDSLLKRGPHGKNTSMISREMIWNLSGHCTYQLTVLLVLVYAGAGPLGILDGAAFGQKGSPTQHYSMVFNTFVLMQLCNQVNMRKLHHEFNPLSGLLDNPIFCFITLIELGAHVLIMFFGGYWFHVTTITWQQWLICIVLGLLEFPVQTLITLFARLDARYRRSRATETKVGDKSEEPSPGIVVRSASAVSIKAAGSGLSAVRGGLRRISDAKRLQPVSSFGREQMLRDFSAAAQAYRSKQN